MTASQGPHADLDKTRARRSAIVLMVAAATLWSTGGLGVKLVNAPALTIAGFRSLFASLMLLVYLGFRSARLGKSPVRYLVSPWSWLGAGSYALMVVCFVLSAKLTSAANAILIQYTGPIYVALLSWPLLKERLRRWDVFAIVGCVVGMAVFFWSDLEGRALHGNAIAVLSSLGFGTLPVLLKLQGRRDETRGETTASPLAPLVTIVLGNLLAVLVSLRSMWGAPPGSAFELLVLFLLGTVQIGLPYILYGIAVPRLRAVESSLIAAIEPALSPLWVLFATGERPGVAVVLGGALIIGSVSLPVMAARLAGSAEKRAP
jgi:drug/metabolite transporter (DMT)-like permease